MRRNSSLAPGPLLVLGALSALLIAPVDDPPSAPPAMLDALIAGERQTTALDALAQSGGLAPGESFKVSEIGRDAYSSHHLVWIRDREVPHRHDRHDLFVVILRGHGGMTLGDSERVLGEGSILYVPRGTVHTFRNASAEPAVAYAVYVPAFDGVDRVTVRAPGRAGP